MNELAWTQPFLTSLAIGLLIGLERQRSAAAHAGLRTFPLVAVLGALSAMLDARSGDAWMLPAGLILVGGMMISAYRDDVEVRDPGTTTTVAVMVCYALGALSWHGEYQLVVALALATTALLHFKDELHGFATRLSRDDVVAVLRFVVLSVLLLPLLPDRGYGPYAALNPYKLWWMVVLISGLSLGGYLLLRLIGPGRGVPLLGVLGGLASSTATTLSFARHAKLDAQVVPAARTVILIANLMVLLRLSVLAAVVAPVVLTHLLPAMVGGLLAGGAWVLVGLRREASSASAAIELGNPGEFRAAFGFALLYGVVLVVVAFLQDYAGDAGVYIAAAVSGLTDVDAISLSALGMIGEGRLSMAAAVNALLIAFFANLLFKAGTVAVVAGGALVRPVLLGFLVMSAGVLIGRVASGLLAAG